MEKKVIKPDFISRLPAHDTEPPVTRRGGSMTLVMGKAVRLSHDAERLIELKEILSNYRR